MDDSIPNKENIGKTPKSPCLLKPKALCFKRKPKRSFNAAPLASIDANVDSSSGTVGFLSKSIATINPFKCVETSDKRRRIAVESDFASLQKEKVNRDEEQTSNTFSTSIVPAIVNEDAHLGFSTAHFVSKTACPKTENQQRERDIPIDWSLKTKIRIVSSKPFPWRTSFRTSEEASGTTGFVRCLYSGDKTNNCNLDSSHGARLYQQCLVWVHPSIPWLSLFPRISSNQTQTNSQLPSLDQRYIDVLHSNWCDSFRSLYQLVRTCQCPYFYVCASSFTVMFRSGGVGSIIDIHAAIVPTSRGLRKALADEGIEFTMPLSSNASDSGIGLDEKSVDYTQSVSDDEKGDENEETLDEEEEPGTWLESLGLSQQDFPSLNSLSSKRQKEHKKGIDHRPESLVYVEGSETQGLVNFLLNYPSCVTKFGPMAGIPPTLLSPVAFLGATLQANKVQHGKVQEKGVEMHAVELKGPLLPNAVNSLCALFNCTQDGNFRATLTTYQPTLALARLPTSSSFPSVFATENLKDCGLTSSFVQHMCSKSSSYEGKGITTITAENKLFSWT